MARKQSADEDSQPRRRSRLATGCAILFLAAAAAWFVAGAIVPLGLRSRSEPIRLLSFWFIREFHSVLPFRRAALAQGLRSPDPFVRELVASQIGESRIVSVRRELVGAFASEPDREARSAMIGAIVDLGETDVVPRLVPIALTSSDSPRPECAPGAARWALAELTADPELAMFRGGLGGLHSQLRPGRFLSEKEQIRIVREWWAAHKNEYDVD
jgi:hypothetical protein